MLNVAPVDQLRSMQAALPHAVQIGSYGCTEVGGVVAYNELEDDLDQRLTTCGRPFPGIEVQVVDPDTQTPLPPGAPGEILVRGYSLFDGYHKDPEQTAAVLDAEGWFHTGDLGSLDDGGRISYRGRLKDMLKVGGENVAAAEIESFLCNHPAVKIVQVVGMPDDRLVEVPVAFVELHDGETVGADELIAFCTGRIASFKVPRQVRFVDQWPMSATKIQKFRLRQQLQAG
jgi:fatty-acyl-CoA synthase